MKCPRCGLAELNNGHCVVCQLKMDSEQVEMLKLEGIKRVLSRIVPKKFATSTLKLWNMNLQIYLHLKIMMFMVALITIGAVVAFLLKTQNLILPILMAWFALMASYEFLKSQKKKEAKS